jgi:uncharacterized cupredoxin-like copper-binding protein
MPRTALGVRDRSQELPMVTKALVGFIAILGSTAASAQAVDWGHATRIEIGLDSFKIIPATTTLRHGEAYVLHFTNRSSGGHDFVAKDFFAHATLAAQDREIAKHGEVELSGGDSADVHLIAPAAGTYEAHCSHFMHATMGMKGQIVVQ